MDREKHSFYFKRFSVRHDRCTMKVGTDGVLLGAWADVQGARSILDIGTGSGVIALMLAQRTAEDVAIDAIEIAEADAKQAAENIRESSWPDKIRVVHSSLQGFPRNKKYDLIVSNPPFFINSSSPPSPERKQARHTTHLSHEELLQGTMDLLSDRGKLCVILPTVEGSIFEATALKAAFNLSKSTAFHSRKEKNQERWLMEFVREPVINPSYSELTLYGNADVWSSDYVGMMKEFYLAL